MTYNRPTDGLDKDARLHVEGVVQIEKAKPKGDTWTVHNPYGSYNPILTALKEIRDNPDLVTVSLNERAARFAREATA